MGYAVKLQRGGGKLKSLSTFSTTVPGGYIGTSGTVPGFKKIIMVYCTYVHSLIYRDVSEQSASYKYWGYGSVKVEDFIDDTSFRINASGYSISTTWPYFILGY